MTASASPGRRLRSVPRMGAVDLAYYAATGGTPLRTGFLLGFQGTPPGVEALRARVAARAAALPVLRNRLTAGRPAVERVDHIAVEDHVHQLRLPDGTGDTDRSGGSQAGRLMLTLPLPDGGRPPWDVWLINGPGNDYILCYRGDHTLQDGTGAAHTVRALLDDRPADGPKAHRPRPPTPRGLADAMSDVLSCLRRPDPLPDAFTIRSAGRSSMDMAEAPLEQLRTVGRAYGGTVNDVYLAALASAIRVWHLKETGTPPLPLPVVVPMSVRGPGDALAPGNRMIMVRLELPCDEVSPADALARVVTQCGMMRRTRRRDATRLLLGATPVSLGAQIGVRVVSGLRAAGPVSGINLGGPLTHGGDTARWAAMFTDVAAGMLCYTSLTGYHRTARLTVVHDMALRGADSLAPLWIDALGELSSGP